VSNVFDLALYIITTLLGQTNLRGFFLGKMHKIGSLRPSLEAVNAREIFTLSPPAIVDFTVCEPLCSYV